MKSTGSTARECKNEAQQQRQEIDNKSSSVKKTEDINPGIVGQEEDMDWDAARKEFVVYSYPSGAESDVEEVTETPGKIIRE